MTITTVLLIIALVLFIVAAVGRYTRFNLTAAGLAFCVAAVLAGDPALRAAF